MLRFVALLVLAVPAFAEDVARCFQIREMAKTEAGRYGVHAVSRCSKTYDAVYVMVSFQDAKGKHMDDGVWAIYWCRPGRVEIHEFAVPRSAYGFHKVVLRGITLDAEQGLGLKKTQMARADFPIPEGPFLLVPDPGER